ncbi:MAG TPA: carbohydrate ABC transporter permease [bacterium]|nr:carbohydrate ABC transporter permease [bacterium]
MAKRVKMYKEETRYLFPSYELKDKKTRVIYGLWGAFTVTGAVLVTIPFIWMLVTAMLPAEMIFKPLKEVMANFKPDASHFVRAWEITPFQTYLFNTFLIALAAVAGQILICSAAAYSLSKLRPPFYQAVMLLFLSTILIPFETIAVPLYLFMRDFGIEGIFTINLVNTYWALILPALAAAINIFIFKSFFDKMPNDFIEAARVDGYSEISIFFRIILPISKAIISVMAVLNFTTIWNSFFWPLIVINEPEIYTLMLGIYKIIEEGQPWNVVMAAVSISMIPTLVLFAVFQRQVMRGVLFTTLQE